MTVEPLLSLRDVADRLGVDYNTVYRIVRRGELPAGKIGNVYRVRPDDVNAYIEQQFENTRRTLQDGTDVAALAAAAGGDDMACANCLRLIKSPDAVGGVCRAAACEAVLCRECHADGVTLCPQHAPGAAEQLAAARRALAAGEIAVLVTTAEARQRAMNYIHRLQRKVRRLEALPHPDGGRPLRNINWDVIETQQTATDDQPQRYMRRPAHDDTSAPLPDSSRLVYRIPAERGRKPFRLAAHVVVHREAYRRAGFDSRPVGADELEPLLLALAAAAEVDGQPYVVALVSVSGWGSDALALLTGRAPGEGWVQRHVLPLLVDLVDRRVHVNPTQPAVQPYIPLFTLPLPEEEVFAVEQFVRANLAIPHATSLAASEIEQTLNVSAGAVLTAMQRLVAEGDYLIEDVPQIGAVIGRLRL